MQELFDDLVVLFTAVSRQSELSYTELNILVYCGLVPLSWLGLMVVRQPWCRALLLAYFPLASRLA